MPTRSRAALVNTTASLNLFFGLVCFAWGAYVLWAGADAIAALFNLKSQAAPLLTVGPRRR